MAKEKERTAILHCRMKPEELAVMDDLVKWLDTDDRTTLIRRLVKDAHNRERRRREKTEKNSE